MRDVVTIDLRGLYEKRITEPNKSAGGTRRIMTNEEEWYIWTLYDHLIQKQIANDLKCGKDRIPEEYKRLKAQGGPKGEKPEWIK